MTYEKALIIINNTSVQVKLGSAIDFHQALLFAEDAMKKQIPRRIVEGHCPHCALPAEPARFCCHCGQALVFCDSSS